MAGAFMVIQADITDAERFKKYAMRAPALIEQYGGRYRAMRGELEQLEGPTDTRKLVISEWPSMDAARAFWNSPAYAELKLLRKDAARINVYLTEITGD